MTKKVNRESRAKRKKMEMRKKQNTTSVFLYIPTEILLYTFEYFYLHYITKWLLEAMFVNFLSWATCDKEINYVGSG